MRMLFIATACLLLVACGDAKQTQDAKAVGGALNAVPSKTQSIPKGGLDKVFDIEESKPADASAAAKNLDKAFDIEESKPADASAAAKNLDKVFDIEETKPAEVKNLDRVFDIEETKPAEIKPNETIAEPTLSEGTVPTKEITKTGPQLPTASPGANPGTPTK